ncbi:hypothetical protein CDES_13925 [Corynebacterium deserti GIMN1.010]|uniref:6-phosphogluconolactonase n=1 Tax=Corynebacterium deserti GIMN1.010 TaxID=931089 RepID=A0A0M4CP14_9CORY|nr:hypothetical protein CDES_13925 [Corynebacterium deserti GIMN1.010]
MAHPDLPFIYAAHGNRSTVSSYYLGAHGTLEFIRDISTEGTNPAHIAISPDARFLLGINHTSGSFFSIALDNNGHLDNLVQLHRFQGEPGPHKSDQHGSKPHQVGFAPALDEATGEYTIAIPDKGLDVVHFGRFNPQTGSIAFGEEVRLREVSGPRHAVFHPHKPALCAINELSPTVAVISLDAGKP